MNNILLVVLGYGIYYIQTHSETRAKITKSIAQFKAAFKEQWAKYKIKP